MLEDVWLLTNNGRGSTSIRLAQNHTGGGVGKDLIGRKTLFRKNKKEVEPTILTQFRSIGAGKETGPRRRGENAGACLNFGRVGDVVRKGGARKWSIQSFGSLALE